MAEIGGFLRRQNRAQLLLDLCRVLAAGEAQQVADTDAVRVAHDRAGGFINVPQQQIRRLPAHARQAQQLLTAHGDAALYVVGEYGRRWFAQRGIAIEESFHYTAQNPTLDRARHIAELLLERFDAGEISAVWVIYTDMKNGLEAVVRQERILPMHREHFHAAAAAAAGDKAYEFVPSAGAVLDNAARSCLTGYIYSALVDSFCSEQSARMTAMNAADQNAEELLKDLSVQYNRARQAAITQEITEVSAGERAQRSKKEKEG